MRMQLSVKKRQGRTLARSLAQGHDGQQDRKENEAWQQTRVTYSHTDHEKPEAATSRRGSRGEE